jgi:class 3 adenylate cyclase/tetratricopeptide (TPR) repeat protein
MKCPKCQFENSEGSKFCNECGVKLETACPKCGIGNQPGSKFCNQCGHQFFLPAQPTPKELSFDEKLIKIQKYLPGSVTEKILAQRGKIEGERKRVTVMFTDMKNFTPFVEKIGPEEAYSTMDQVFEILIQKVYEYEGTVNKMTGDGIMALFGAPIALEDHAQRACYAALAIQEALIDYAEKVKRKFGVDFKMRIGLNSGLVLIGAVGNDLRMEYTTIGDTTTLASRMESIAKPGTILVSKATYKLVKEYFRFSPLGFVVVKGKEDPQEAFELLGAGEVATRIGASVAKGLTRFVGRRNSMAAFMEAYELAQSGSGQVIDVVGEAGVGKSRLLLEFRSRLPQGESTFLEGRCLHYGSSMAYLPILDILRSYLKIDEGEREQLIRQKIEEKVLHLDEKLRGVLVPLYELLSLKIEDPVYSQLDPEEKKQRTFEALRDLIVRLSLEKTLILAVEDLHWIDRISERFIDYLIGWLPKARILLILLHRPEYNHPWGNKSYCSKIGVNQLSIESSSELVHAILEDREAAPEIRELILSKAGGNPLFVEELTRSLLENGSIHRVDGRFVLSRNPSEIQVPETIQGVIAARFDRVEENLKGIMRMASVIGREFAYRILQTISGMAEELKSHLANLQGLEFIYEKSLFPELEYIFKHALTQEVVYSSLLLKRRREIHGKIAEAIESVYPDRLEEFYEALAYHYGRSNNGEKAVDYLHRAMQRATALTAMEEAKAYFDEAMRLLDGLPETTDNQRRRIALLVDNQGYIFMQLLKMPEFHNLLERYHSTAVGLGDSWLLGNFLGCVGYCQWLFGHIDEAVETLNRAVETLEGSGYVVEAGYCYQWLQWCHMIKGNYDQAIVLKEEVLRRVDKRSQLWTYVNSLTVSNYVYIWLGRWDQMLEEGQRAIEAAEEFSNSSMVGFAALPTCQGCSYMGDHHRALEYGELAVQRASTVALRIWAQGTLAYAQARSGEPRKAAETMAAIVPLVRASRFVWTEVLLTAALGEAYWLAGEYEKASQYLQEGLKVSEQCGVKIFIARDHRLLGEVALKTKVIEAEGHFKKSIDVSQEIKAENELALAYAGYGRFLQQQGRIVEAREYLTLALQIFERLGTMNEPDKVRQELAKLP